MLNGIVYAADTPSLITDYHAIFIPGFDDEGKLKIAIRMYYSSDIPYFLLVDPNTLLTKIAPVADFKSRSTDSTPGYYTMANRRCCINQGSSLRA